jgi:hypothetical protein
MNSIRPDLLATAIPVELPDNVPEWVTEDMPAFFTSIADAEKYIQGLREQIETITPLLESAKEYAASGLEMKWHSFFSAKRKYMQQIAITKISIRRIYPGWADEDVASCSIEDLKKRCEDLAAQNKSLKIRLGESNSAIAEAKNLVQSAIAQARKSNEERIKLDTKVNMERKFYLRAIYALLIDDEAAKQKIVEHLSFVGAVADDWGFEDAARYPKAAK